MSKFFANRIAASTQSSRQTATEIYTELRAAFRDGSDYDTAENCSAEKGGRLPRNFRVDLRDKHSRQLSLSKTHGKYSVEFPR